MLLEAHPDILLNHRPPHVLAAEDVERAEDKPREGRHAAEELGEVLEGGVVKGARGDEGHGDGREEGEVAQGEDAGVSGVRMGNGGG